ncbi:MAG: hypothetical protein ABJN96_09555 [Marinomonas sp.]
MLRGPDGLKCPSGMCISDEDYNPSMEYKSEYEWKHNARRSAVFAAAKVEVNSGYDDDASYFLMLLQMVHDITEDSDDFKNKFCS